MGIKFHPDQGAILVCDYGDAIVPEMVKRRPVIVISPRHRRRHGLCTIVPLSTTPPKPIESYHHLLTLSEPLPSPWDKNPVWIKCDMIATVAFARLSLVASRRDKTTGKRTYFTPCLDRQQCQAILEKINIFLGFQGLKSS